MRIFHAAAVGEGAVLAYVLANKPVEMSCDGVFTPKATPRVLLPVRKSLCQLGNSQSRKVLPHRHGSLLPYGFLRMPHGRNNRDPRLAQPQVLSRIELLSASHGQPSRVPDGLLNPERSHSYQVKVCCHPAFAFLATCSPHPSPAVRRSRTGDCLAHLIPGDGGCLLFKGALLRGPCEGVLVFILLKPPKRGAPPKKTHTCLRSLKERKVGCP